MAILRGIGYFIAIVILIIGIVFLPLGLILIIPAIIMIYMLRKGGQVSNMQKDLKRIRKLEEEKAKDDLAKRQRDAMSQGWDE